MKRILWVLIICISIFADLTKQEAIEIALNEVIYMSNRDENDLWTLESKVLNAYPVFLDGIEGVSYYECKVTTNGNDAGYVLVNVNFTDIPIVESSMSGKTLNELYFDYLGHNDYKIFRYDFIRSAATAPDLRSSTSEFDIIASLGFEEGISQNVRGNIPANAMEIVKIYQSKISQNLASPLYTKEILESYYYDTVSNEEQANEIMNRGTWDSDDVELKNSFPNGFKTPDWSQFKRPSGKPIGCGATAWTILYGYWRQFNGKDKLFDGLNLLEKKNLSTYVGYYGNDFKDYGPIKDCAMELYDCMDSWELSGNTATYPSRMPDGKEYAENKGYQTVTVKDVNDGEYDKFSTIYKELKAERPVILYMEIDKDEDNGINDSKFFALHYVVVEGAHKSKYKYIKKWHNRNVSYLVNLGWKGYDRKWLYVRDWGKNQHEVHSCFSAFTVKIGELAEERGVDFVANVISGRNPLITEFTSIELNNDNSTTLDDVKNYYWDFGDGNTSTEKSPVHVYTRPGNYCVKHITTMNNLTSVSRIKENYIKVIGDITPVINLLLD